jgi:hypothetical protein
LSDNGIHELHHERSPVLKYGAPAAGALLLILAGGIALSWFNCVNVHTPAGFEGYVKSRPIAGAGEYVGTQTGPTSTGWVWRQDVVNIDMRPRTFSEEMTIPTNNRVEIALRAHARVKLRRGGVKQVVERLGGEDWYEDNVKDRFRAAVRDQVQRLGPFEVKSEMRAIGDAVLKALAEIYAETPIEFVAIDIGDIRYPDRVVNAVIDKFVTNEDNERKGIQLEIAQKQIEIGVAHATGTRDAQQIIRTTLDPMYLQFEALEAIESLADSPNTTFLVMPQGKGGQAPVILNLSGN